MTTAALLVTLVATACNPVVPGAEGATPSPNSVTTDSTVSGDSGTVVFADDFGDPASGWGTGATPGGVHYGYAGGSYVIRLSGGGNVYDWSAAPYVVPHRQLSVEATGTQSTTAPHATAFGVYCSPGIAEAPPFYEFLDFIDGSWALDRRDGDVGHGRRTVLKTGSAPLPPVSLANVSTTVVGMCATLSDDHTTRLVFEINNVAIADITDTVANLPGPGWNAGIETYSQYEDLAVTVTRFRERAL